MDWGFLEGGFGYYLIKSSMLDFLASIVIIWPAQQSFSTHYLKIFFLRNVNSILRAEDVNTSLSSHITKIYCSIQGTHSKLSWLRCVWHMKSAHMQSSVQRRCWDSSCCTSMYIYPILTQEGSVFMAEHSLISLIVAEMPSTIER